MLKPQLKARALIIHIATFDPSQFFFVSSDIGLSLLAERVMFFQVITSSLKGLLIEGTRLLFFQPIFRLFCICTSVMRVYTLEAVSSATRISSEVAKLISLIKHSTCLYFCVFSYFRRFTKGGPHLPEVTASSHWYEYEILLSCKFCIRILF